MANIEIAASLEAPRIARGFVARQLDRWELNELSDVATLLTSELVTNAVIHAETTSSLVMAVADGSLEIGVGDSDDRLPRRVGPYAFDLSADSDVVMMSEGGRGIGLIDRLADEWGVVALPAGKQVWFRLEAAAWSYRTACQCHGDSVERVRLQSGRFAVAMAGAWDHQSDLS